MLSSWNEVIIIIIINESNVTDIWDEKAHGPTETLTKDLSHAVQAHWPPSCWATRSTCDKSMVTDTAQWLALLASFVRGRSGLHPHQD